MSTSWQGSTPRCPQTSPHGRGRPALAGLPSQHGLAPGPPEGAPSPRSAPGRGRAASLRPALLSRVKLCATGLRAVFSSWSPQLAFPGMCSCVQISLGMMRQNNYNVLCFKKALVLCCWGNKAMEDTAPGVWRLLGAVVINGPEGLARVGDVLPLAWGSFGSASGSPAHTAGTSSPLGVPGLTVVAGEG